MAKASTISALGLGLFLAGHVHAQGITDYKPGEGGGPITGSASGTEVQQAAPSLERCAAPLGTMTVAEPQEFTQRALMRYNLASPTGLIRLIIQQSNCFQVIERGVAMQNILQERRLMQQGELKEGNEMGRGQLVTADFVLTPDVVFAENNAGGIGGIIGGFFGPLGAIVASGLKFKQAQTSMIVADTRSGVQVAAAQGSAEKADFGIGGVAAGIGTSGLAVGGLGAYENTAEGKVVAASFLDNWNSVVKAMRGNPSLVRVSAAPREAATKEARPPGESLPPKPPALAFEKGDVLVGKIGGIKMLAEPSEQARTIGTLSRSDAVTFLGQEVDGYLHVQGERGTGWIGAMFLRKGQ